MAREPFPDLPDLAVTTLMMACDPLMFYGPGRKELLRDWRLVLSMCNLPGTKDVDWGAVRNLFRNSVPAEILTDGEFRDAMDSVFTEIYGAPEGGDGTSKVLDG